MSSNEAASTEPFTIDSNAGGVNGPNHLIMRGGRHVGILYSHAERQEDFEVLLAAIESVPREIIRELVDAMHRTEMDVDSGLTPLRRDMIARARAFLGESSV